MLMLFEISVFLSAANALGDPQFLTILTFTFFYEIFYKLQQNETEMVKNFIFSVQCTVILLWFGEIFYKMLILVFLFVSTMQKN